MRIEHVAVWTEDAERLRDFYVRWFAATHGARYQSRNRHGFASYFLAFPDGGARLEVMTVGGLAAHAGAREAVGLAHLAVALGSEDAVDALVARLREAGVPVESPPRRTGDGYYEAVIRDPDGNLVEITA